MTRGPGNKLSDYEIIKALQMEMNGTKRRYLYPIPNGPGVQSEWVTEEQAKGKFIIDFCAHVRACVNHWAAERQAEQQREAEGHFGATSAEPTSENVQAQKAADTDPVKSDPVTYVKTQLRIALDEVDEASSAATDADNRLRQALRNGEKWRKIAKALGLDLEERNNDDDTEESEDNGSETNSDNGTRFDNGNLRDGRDNPDRPG
jgi:hypothetical protein